MIIQLTVLVNEIYQYNSILYILIYVCSPSKNILKTDLSHFIPIESIFGPNRTHCSRLVKMQMFKFKCQMCHFVADMLMLLEFKQTQ